MLKGFSFTKQKRIRKNENFRRVFAKRKRISNTYFSLYYRTNRQEHPRLGVVASKRAIRLAVERNRVKRIVREKFRLCQNQLPSLDMVIVAQMKAGSVSRRELNQSLEKLFEPLISCYKPSSSSS